ncbi:MAG: hypothetical protein Rubg2KO_08360 [Rubricoccaceae bacterium]
MEWSLATLTYRFASARGRSGAMSKGAHPARFERVNRIASSREGDSFGAFALGMGGSQSTPTAAFPPSSSWGHILTDPLTHPCQPEAAR